MNGSALTKTSVKMAAGLLVVAALVGACSSGSGANGGLYGNQGATGAVVATMTPAAALPAALPAAGATTVTTKVIGSQTVLVAGSSGMTLYQFANDMAGSGKSTCVGGCLTKWPALTVAAVATPAAGDGVAGQLGTITRADDGSLQMTYNGLPLYFYSGDKAVGDTNGSYPGWNLVKP